MANCFLLLALQLKSKCLSEASVKENCLLTPSTPGSPFCLIKKAIASSQLATHASLLLP